MALRDIVWVGTVNSYAPIQERHRYLTIVADLERSRSALPGRRRQQASLDGFWLTLPSAPRDGITAVAMDMWEPCVQSTRAHLPGAEGKIVLTSSTSPSPCMTPTMTYDAVSIGHSSATATCG